MTKEQIIERINMYREAIEQATDADVNTVLAYAMLDAVER